MLAGCNFMMTVFDTNSHRFKGEDGFPTKVRCVVEGDQVKISSPVEGLRFFSELLK